MAAADTALACSHMVKTAQL